LETIIQEMIQPVMMPPAMTHNMVAKMPTKTCHNASKARMVTLVWVARTMEHFHFSTSKMSTAFSRLAKLTTG
jgi:hypothetical protein